MRSAQFVVVFCLFGAAAAVECDGDAHCAAEPDADSLLQSAAGLKVSLNNAAHQLLDAKDLVTAQAGWCSSSSALTGLAFYGTADVFSGGKGFTIASCREKCDSDSRCAWYIFGASGWCETRSNAEVTANLASASGYTTYQCTTQATTCETFTSCPQATTVNKGSDVTCSGECDAATCCEATTAAPTTPAPTTTAEAITTKGIREEISGLSNKIDELNTKLDKKKQAPVTRRHFDNKITPIGDAVEKLLTKLGEMTEAVTSKCGQKDQGGVSGGPATCATGKTHKTSAAATVCASEGCIVAADLLTCCEATCATYTCPNGMTLRSGRLSWKQPGNSRCCQMTCNSLGASGTTCDSGYTRKSANVAVSNSGNFQEICCQAAHRRRR